MPVLRKTEFTGIITWMGMVPAGAGIAAQPREQLELSFAGIEGERHAGENRASCVRVRNLYAEGSEIRNVRQLSILSEEELALVAADMGLQRLDPADLGATLVLRGIPDFTFVPPNARLQSAGGATVTIDMENRPCVLPGREIEKHHAGFGAKFKPSAANRRGVTAWVEHPGVLKLGEALSLFVPDQRGWQGEPVA